jgi:hypothetical protein
MVRMRAAGVMMRVQATIWLLAALRRVAAVVVQRSREWSSPRLLALEAAVQRRSAR